MAQTATSVDSRAPQSTSTALRAGSLGVVSLMFFVFAAQAPLTGLVGPTPITIAAGNGAGAPAASLIVGAVICLFAVGFIEMSRHVEVHGAFYAYVTEALGIRLGVGSAWVAILAYGTIQAAMYGLYGAVFAGMLTAWTGVMVPWWAVAVTTMLLVLFLGSRNIEVGARLLIVLVAAEFLIIVAFIVGVMIAGTPEGFDLGASFSPGAVASGAPGVAVVFAVASMVGFESTAIYAGEAKDPKRTIPLATYLAVGVVALFYAFSLWIVISYYGPSNVIDAAAASLEGDSSMFVIAAMADVLGPWAGDVAGILLVSSLLAGILAFHSGVNRYVHSLAVRHALPAAFARTNRHDAPANAARLQTVMALLTVMPFALVGADPTLTLFPWGGGVAVMSLMVLYILCSVSVVVFFRRRAASLVRTRVIPVIALTLLSGLLVLVVINFSALTGGSGVLSALLIGLIPVAFIAGYVSTFLFPLDGPVAREPGPYRNHSEEIA